MEPVLGRLSIGESNAEVERPAMAGIFPLRGLGTFPLREVGNCFFVWEAVCARGKTLPKGDNGKDWVERRSSCCSMTTRKLRRTASGKCFLLSGFTCRTSHREDFETMVNVE